MSKKFQDIFLWTMVLAVVHGLEEYVTGFYTVDKSFLLLLGWIGDKAIVFVVYQLVLWLLLLMLYLAVRKGLQPRTLLWIVGIVMVLELQHLYEALTTWQYYPGLYTSLLFPILALFYFRALGKPV